MPTSLRRLFLLTVLALALSVASLAQAGGWFVITLDSLPASATAGQPLTIGFMLRQHGRTPVFWDGLSVVAQNEATGQRLQVTPQTQGPTGHYTADLTFPSSGAWEWGIDVNQDPWVRWAPLAVAAASSTLVSGSTAVSEPAAQPTAIANPWLPLLLALAATALFLAALQLGRRRRALGGLLGLGAAAGALTLVMVLAAAPPTVVTASAAPSGAGAGQVSEGRALFLAKGCVTCHVHAEAPSRGFVSVDIGPVLTNYVAPAGSPFLRQWLADPKSLRPATEMPDLDLSPQEIASLIAFLSN
ncbi:MAG: c-type cytochrome [Caldilineales bacterium]|nr:c-type cytochrome [Caldilineales bacterium]